MKRRTKGQNEILVTHVLDELAKGGIVKTVAAQFKIPLYTLTKLLSRYKKRHGFKSTYQMLAVYITIKRGKHGRVL